MKRRRCPRSARKPKHKKTRSSRKGRLNALQTIFVDPREKQQPNRAAKRNFVQ